MQERGRQRDRSRKIPPWMRESEDTIDVRDVRHERARKEGTARCSCEGFLAAPDGARPAVLA